MKLPADLARYALNLVRIPPEKEELSPPDYKELKRNQKLNIAEGALNAVTVGLTSSFIVPFALVLGASSTLVAAVSTLPALIAAFAQLGVQKVRMLFRTRRMHMFAFSLLQALTWLPLLFIHQLPHPAIWLVGIVTLNTIFGFLTTPVWNSFTADIVPESERGRFFGIRNTWTGVSSFAATLFAGLLLNWLRPTHPVLGFGILFALAFAFRAVSAYLFTRMTPPPEGKVSTDMPEPHTLLLNANATPFGRFTLFLVLFYVSVYISSPFFAVYQLSVLGFSYLQFTILTCTGAISSFVTMFLWGRYVDRIGSRNVMMSCGLLVPVVPLVWAITPSYPILLVTEVFSGIVWAGFNLSVSTYIFDTTERENRTRQIAEYTVLIQLAMFAGAMAGGQIIKHYGEGLALAYTNVFFLSAALRFAMVVLFYKVIKEQRLIEIPIRGRVFRGLVAIRPQQGLVYDAAIESVQAAGRFVRQSARDIHETVLGMGKPRPKRPFGKMEVEEYEKGFERYRRRKER